jgi:hypothetical protein
MKLLTLKYENLEIPQPRFQKWSSPPVLGLSTASKATPCVAGSGAPDPSVFQPVEWGETWIRFSF